HERSGHAMSTFFIFYDLGIASGAFIWGIVISGSGFTAMYIIGAILILITAYVLYLWLSKQEKRKETKQEVYRSEEHTSELQSRFDIVCRLLLEKKKNKMS